MNSLEVKKSAEAIAARVWERGGSRDAVMEAVREAFVLDTDGDLCAAVRHAGAWLDAVEAVPEYDDDDVNAARALLMDLGALAEGTPSPGEVQP